VDAAGAGADGDRGDDGARRGIDHGDVAGALVGDVDAITYNLGACGVQDRERDRDDREGEGKKGSQWERGS
jgi:hypothetical protein